MVATASLSDSGQYAWVYDVFAATAVRGRGLARALFQLLLMHPAVRGVQGVNLSTADAMRLYEKLGFVARATFAPRPYISHDMVLVRPRPM